MAAGGLRMKMPVIDICPLREPLEGKLKSRNIPFLRALGLKMDAPESSNEDRLSIQKLAGVFAQLPFSCDLNLHLRDGRVITLQWLPNEPSKQLG